MLKSVFSSLLLTAITTFAPSQQGSQKPDDAAFYPVTLRVTEEISSATAKLGQRVQIEVVSPVTADGKLLVPAAAKADAFVSEVRHRGHNRRDGKVSITVRSVVGTDGKPQLVRTATFWQGSGHGQPVFGPCTFPLPADPVGLFRKGNDVSIPKGYTITVALPKA